MRPKERREAVERARLYLVAPALPSDLISDLLAAGVDLLQIREKDAEALDLLEVAEPLVHVCDARGVPFIVNDRPDVAYALGADGVHLGQGDLPPHVARELIGPGMLIGRSTHSPQDIERAVAEHGAGLIDYIAVGPVHATPTKPGRPHVGYDLLRHAAAHVSFPWFAIGGIDETNLPQVREAGAQRVVVVRAITEASDPVAAARTLREALE